MASMSAKLEKESLGHLEAKQQLEQLNRLVRQKYFLRSLHLSKKI